MLTPYRPRRSNPNASAARKTRSTSSSISLRNSTSAHHPTRPSTVVLRAPPVPLTDRNTIHSTKESFVKYARSARLALQRAASDCLRHSAETGKRGRMGQKASFESTLPLQLYDRALRGSSESRVTKTSIFYFSPRDFASFIC